MERHATHIYIYSNFNIGTNPLVQGLGSWITLQFTGFDAAERFAQKLFHATRTEHVHRVKYASARSLFFPAGLNQPVRIWYSLCPAQ